MGTDFRGEEERRKVAFIYKNMADQPQESMFHLSSEAFGGGLDPVGLRKKKTVFRYIVIIAMK